MKLVVQSLENDLNNQSTILFQLTGLAKKAFLRPSDRLEGQPGSAQS